MPTYAQLQSEAVWGAQFAPPSLDALADRLSAHFGVPVWVAGNEDHVYGRHRSRDWCLTSRFCTNRAYGTKDARDSRGDGRWYRAFDLAVQGQPLWDVSARVDAAVRAGQLPELAEWFGTVDGQTVVGWYEGHPSTSDDSHLSHLHGGVWTESADDSAVMDRIFNVITGAETPAAPVPPSTEEDDDMATKGIILQDQTGIARVYDHPTTGEPVWANIGSVEAVGGWNALGWPGPIGVASISAHARPVGDVAREVLDAFKAGSGGGPIEVKTSPGKLRATTTIEPAE